MPDVRIALANLRVPSTPDESVSLAQRAVEEAARQRADFICFPECFVPGYRSAETPGAKPDARFLADA